MIYPAMEPPKPIAGLIQLKLSSPITKGVTRMKIRLCSAIALLALVAIFSGCNKNSGSSEGVKLQGAGASFPAPLYTKWFKISAAAIRMCRWIISPWAAAAARRASSTRPSTLAPAMRR